MSSEPTSSAAARPTRFPWPPFLLVVVIAGGFLLGRWMPLTWPGIDDAPARAIGLSLGAAGVLLLAWASLTLRRHRTTIMPHQKAESLVTDGPYAFRRNPIYLADVLILLGIAEATKNFWFAPLALLFALLVTVLAIVPEERHLEARFGEAWRAYADKTRRWI